MPYTVYTVIYTAVKYLIDLLEMAIFITVILSWLPIKKDNKIIGFIYLITEPVMAPIRTLLHKSTFTKNLMVDFSPIVAIMLLELLKTIFYNIVVRIIASGL